MGKLASSSLSRRASRCRSETLLAVPENVLDESSTLLTGLRSLVRLFCDGLLLLDMNQCMYFVDEDLQDTLSFEDLEGQHVARIVAKRDQERFQDALSKATLTEPQFTSVCLLCAGGVGTMEAKLVVVATEVQQPKHIIGVRTETPCGLTRPGWIHTREMTSTGLSDMGSSSSFGEPSALASSVSQSPRDGWDLTDPVDYIAVAKALASMQHGEGDVGEVAKALASMKHGEGGEGKAELQDSSSSTKASTWNRSLRKRLSWSGVVGTARGLTRHFSAGSKPQLTIVHPAPVPDLAPGAAAVKPLARPSLVSSSQSFSASTAGVRGDTNAGPPVSKSDGGGYARKHERSLSADAISVESVAFSQRSRIRSKNSSRGRFGRRDARASSLGSNASIGNFKLTPNGTFSFVLDEMMPHLNVGRSALHCCMWHMSVRRFMEAARELRAMPCRHTGWLPHSGWQCDECLALNDVDHMECGICCGDRLITDTVLRSELDALPG